MALSVKKKKRKEEVVARVDHRDLAARTIDKVVHKILLASRSKASDKNLVNRIVEEAEAASLRLKKAMEADPDMATEEPDTFADAETAVASFDAIASELKEVDLPDPPLYNKDLFEEAVSDGNLCLGNTGFVIPSGFVVTTPVRTASNVNNARIVTDDHVKAGAKVKKIIEKHISEEE